MDVDLEVGMLQALLGSEVEIGRGPVVGMERADLGFLVVLVVGMARAELGLLVVVGMARAELGLLVVGMARAELGLLVVVVVDIVQAVLDHLSTSDWFVGLGVGTVRGGLVDPHIPGWLVVAAAAAEEVVADLGGYLRLCPHTGTGLDRHS